MTDNTQTGSDIDVTRKDTPTEVEADKIKGVHTELDKILDSFFTVGTERKISELKQEVLDWHNKQAGGIEATAYNRGEVDAKEYWQEEARKQVAAVLDRLSNQQETLHWWTGGEYEKTKAVDMRAIEAERNKLKESK